MHKIYNLIMGHKLDAIFQAVKSGQYPIVYLIIFKKICFLNQYGQHTIQYIGLATRQLYNTIQYTNENTTA